MLIGEATAGIIDAGGVIYDGRDDPGATEVVGAASFDNFDGVLVIIAPPGFESGLYCESDPRVNGKGDVAILIIVSCYSR